uniref:Uncharacterized protein n=1 Tax=Setaria italica TaxID=4555 RepID=K3YP17_SETIT
MEGGAEEGGGGGCIVAAGADACGLPEGRLWLIRQIDGKTGIA